MAFLEKLRIAKVIIKNLMEQFSSVCTINKVRFLFGAGAEISYGMPIGGKNEIDPRYA